MSATQTYRTNAHRYVLDRPIHEGLIATVWHARDTVAGVDVVVKQLNGANAGDATARARLREESVIMHRISHPGAVPVVDTLFDQERAALVFPFVPGETLAERLHTGDPLTFRDAARVCLDLADVLAAAHAVGVVHRDVKPANILLADDGRARLLDFGIARTEAPLDLTGSGMAIGTLPYMAPEQLTGTSPLPAADVFALGVVLYEMLAGRRPFNGTSPEQQLALQRTAPAALNAPEPLAALVTTMLSSLPSARPSAEQIGRALRGWLDGRYEAEAVTAPVVPFAPTPVRTTPRVAGFGVVLVALLLIGAVTLLGFGAVPPSALDPWPVTTPPAAAANSPEPTPTHLPPPTPRPPATTSNQPTTARSGPIDSGPSKAQEDGKKEGKHKKPGHRPKHSKGKKAH